MDSAIFEIIYNSYKINFSDNTSWDFYAKKYDFVSKEAVRSWFKRQRKSRGLPSKNDLLQPETEIKKQKIEFKSPRVGVLDVETLPGECYYFELFNQNIGIEQVISEVCLLSWSGKYINESEVFSDILTSAEAPVKDTERIVKSCWEFMSKFDAIIGHNICGFDSKVMNTYFLKFNLPPLKYVMIDTLQVARNNFRFSSNKLSFINRQLGIRDKFSNEGFPLWRDCHKGIQKALDEMLRYNIGDIFATESLFYRVRPYVRNFNVALYNEISENQCPVCGSKELKTEGFYMTSAGKYESVRCQDCKCISRKKDNLFTKEKKKSLLINS